MKKLMKIVAILACAAILVAGSVAGTFAYLAMKTTPITNTFTAGNIEITLTEGSESAKTFSYKMIPGQVYTKDPKVTVEAKSEKCWLFVKIDKSTNFDTFLTYNMAEGWTELDSSGSGVYYRVVDVSAADTDAVFAVFDGNKLTAKSDATKAEYETLTNALYLNVTAYAVQYDGFGEQEFDALLANAWGIASALGTP